jgi:hypothetical protein
MDKYAIRVMHNKSNLSSDGSKSGSNKRKPGYGGTYDGSSGVW